MHVPPRWNSAGDPDEGAAVFLVGRRVHDDPRAAIRQRDAKVTPKAGVGRGRFDVHRLVGELWCEKISDPVTYEGGARHAASPSSMMLECPDFSIRRVIPDSPATKRTFACFFSLTFP
jgi:hypothetical protein